jgi:hypothetical protein
MKAIRCIVAMIAWRTGVMRFFAKIGVRTAMVLLPPRELAPASQKIDYVDTGPGRQLQESTLHGDYPLAPLSRVAYRVSWTTQLVRELSSATSLHLATRQDRPCPRLGSALDKIRSLALLLPIQLRAGSKV